jgi:hypothetical protein
MFSACIIDDSAAHMKLGLLTAATESDLLPVADIISVFFRLSSIRVPAHLHPAQKDRVSNLGGVG